MSIKKYADGENERYKLTIRRIKWSICQTPRATNYAVYFFVGRQAIGTHYTFTISSYPIVLYVLSVCLVANILIADDYIGLIKRQ